MTDPELIAKKLAEIETYVRELRTLVSIVHSYQKLNLNVLSDVLQNRLSDLIAFVEVIRERAR